MHTRTYHQSLPVHGPAPVVDPLYLLQPHQLLLSLATELKLEALLLLLLALQQLHVVSLQQDKERKGM